MGCASETDRSATVRMTKLAEAGDPGKSPDYWGRARKKPATKMEVEEERGMLGDDEPQYKERAGWRSLFIFTTKRHYVTLFFAAAFSGLSGIVMPTVAIVLGRIFDDFTRFGAHQLNRHELISRITTGCLTLVEIASLSWFLNSAFYLLWMVFGELQAKTVRDKLFEGLLNRDIEWYDRRKDGIGALVPRFQTQVH